MKQGIKSVSFKAQFVGNGCVNYDSTEQRFFLNIDNNSEEGSEKKDRILTNFNDNLMLSKKSFMKDADGKVFYKVKVSSECLRHSMFAETMPYQNPNLAGMPFVLYNAMALPDYLLRGYMFTRKNHHSFKKKSPLCITDAVEVGPWHDKVHMDFCSSTMEKDMSAKGEDDMGSTSIYSKENVGAKTYEAEGFIDVQELSFIPADIAYDRLSVYNDNSEFVKIYKDALSKNLVDFKPEFKFYYQKNAFTGDEMAEEGILLNPQSVDMLIKLAFKHIQDIDIRKRDAYFKFDKFSEIVVNYDNGDSEILDASLIFDFFFKYADKYFEADTDKINKNRQLIAEYKQQQKEENKKQKEAKKAAKKKNKKEVVE